MLGWQWIYLLCRHQFAHPLHHLGKSKEDLPLLAIDSFRSAHIQELFGNIIATFFIVMNVIATVVSVKNTVAARATVGNITATRVSVVNVIGNPPE